MEKSLEDYLAEGWLPTNEMKENLGCHRKTLFRRWKAGELERMPHPIGGRGFLYRVVSNAWTQTEKEAYENERKYEVYEKVFFDGERYIFTDIPGRAGKKGKIALPKDVVQSIVEAYSNEDGAPATINELAAKLKVRHRTMYAIKAALELTHDSPPWTREHAQDTPESVLFDDLIGMKMERVRAKAEKAHWEKTKRDAEKLQRFDLYVVDKLRNMPPCLPTKLPRIHTKKKTGFDYLTVLIPFDLHITKECARLGLAPSRDRFYKAMDQAMGYLHQFGNPSRFLMSTGGDLFNSDNYHLTTLKGTPQRHVGGFPEMAEQGRQVTIDMIEMGRSVADVTFAPVIGNHGPSIETMSAYYLAGQYEAAKDVEILKPRMLHGIEYGQNLIGLSHGIKKPKTVIEKMSDLFAPSWGRCPFRYEYHGHWHQETEVEFAGTRSKGVGTLGPRDRWEEDEMMFTGLPLLSIFLHRPDSGRFAQFEVMILDESSKPERAEVIPV